MYNEKKYKNMEMHIKIKNQIRMVINRDSIRSYYLTDA